MSRIAQGFDVYDRLDHVGIFLLIAGSYTPIAWNMLQSRWRFGVLASAWGDGGSGINAVSESRRSARHVGTTIYLIMGWGAIFCYIELSRSLSHKRLFPLVLGGVFYSVGAVINLLHWPIIVPGFFGSHELFHVFVMAGSLTHYLFMLNVVLPSRPALSLHPLRPKTPIVMAVKVIQPNRNWITKLQLIWIKSHIHLER